MLPLHIAMTVGAAALTAGEDAGEAEALGTLSFCPAQLLSLGKEGGGSQRKHAAAWDVSSSVLGINSVGINKKHNVACKEFSFES